MLSLSSVHTVSAAGLKFIPRYLSLSDKAGFSAGADQLSISVPCNAGTLCPLVLAKLSQAQNRTLMLVDFPDDANARMEVFPLY